LPLLACGQPDAPADASAAQSWDGADGSHYQGQFRDGQFSGLGVLERADGSRHEGHFDHGQPNGLGVRIDASGERLAGRFENGLLQGQGRYLSPEGDRYDGGFLDDQFAGQGVYTSADGERWSGTFANGSLQGQGEHQDLDGNRYQGAFVDWQYAGEGRLQRSDGSVYQGQFKDGRFAGEGVLTRADGTREAGLWRNGRRWQDENGQRLADSLELALLDQGRLLEAQLQALPRSTPAVELYALTLAGDGRQSVFMREADYVANLLRTDFAARGEISLVNHREHLADRPLATRESLARSLQALAERSGPEDLIFIYLTSHGGHEHTLSLAQPGLDLLDLDARELPQMLAVLGERRRILVVSACYSGGFITPLKDDEKTLVITAASADRVSFGCSEEADFTYFGRAFFAEALQQTGDLAEAYRLASASIADRERAEGFAASQPQMHVAQDVLRAWDDYRKALPVR